MPSETVRAAPRVAATSRRPVNFGTEGRANRVIVRAIVPRTPKLSLLPFVQLVRPSVQLVTVPTGAGRGTRTAFGDFQLFDLAVLPWPDQSTGPDFRPW